MSGTSKPLRVQERPEWAVSFSRYFYEVLEQIDRLQQDKDAMLSALQECENYLDEHAEVIDGDYGQPKANEEMMLLMEVSDAIRKAKRP